MDFAQRGASDIPLIDQSAFSGNVTQIRSVNSGVNPANSFLDLCPHDRDHVVVPAMEEVPLPGVPDYNSGYTFTVEPQLHPTQDASQPKPRKNAAKKSTEGSKTATGKEFHCLRCNYSCANESMLKIHKKMHHRPMQRFNCAMCTFSTRYKQSLRNHYLGGQHRLDPAVIESLMKRASSNATNNEANPNPIRIPVYDPRSNPVLDVVNEIRAKRSLPRVATTVASVAAKSLAEDAETVLPG